jgi:anti-sigma regulatory factor (Ser/Thr protein kinase)
MMSRDPCKGFHKLAFRIPGNRGAIKHLVDEIVQSLSKKGFKIDGEQLKLILSEALTNAFLYGSLQLSSDLRESHGDNFFWQMVDRRERDKKYSSNKINVEIECINNALRFRIEDKGKGFDWDSHLKIMTKERSETSKDGRPLKTHGRGLWIIKESVDDLKWNKRGNEIYFTMKLPADTP